MKRMREVSPQLSAAEREAKLSPYRSIIDKYVLRFSDKPLRYPGALGSYGTERRWAKLFIEVYVLNHGRLPDQKLWIDVLVDRGGYGATNTDLAGSWKISEPAARPETLDCSFSQENFATKINADQNGQLSCA